jgi:hypothetical protein
MLLKDAILANFTHFFTGIKIIMIDVSYNTGYAALKENPLNKLLADLFDNFNNCTDFKTMCGIVQYF